MNFAEINLLVGAARRREVEYQGAKFQVILPSDEEIIVPFRTMLRDSGSVDPAKINPVACRELVASAIVGWSGVRAEAFVAGGGGDEVEFSEQTRDLLLVQRLDLVTHIFREVTRLVGERRKSFEAARKNSASGSSGISARAA